MGTFHVVIPCFNYGEWLPGCIESVLASLAVDVRATIVEVECMGDDII